MRHLLALLSAACAVFAVVQADDDHAAHIREILEGLDPKLKEYTDGCMKNASVNLDTCCEEYKQDPAKISSQCKCIVKCVGEKAGVVRADGTVDYDELKKQIEEIKEEANRKKALYIFSKCKDSDQGKGGCDGPFRLLVCVIAETKACKKKECN